MSVTFCFQTSVFISKPQMLKARRYPHRLPASSQHTRSSSSFWGSSLTMFSTVRARKGRQETIAPQVMHMKYCVTTWDQTRPTRPLSVIYDANVGNSGCGNSYRLERHPQAICMLSNVPHEPRQTAGNEGRAPSSADRIGSTPWLLPLRSDVKSLRYSATNHLSYWKNWSKSWLNSKSAPPAAPASVVFSALQTDSMIGSGLDFWLTGGTTSDKPTLFRPLGAAGPCSSKKWAHPWSANVFPNKPWGHCQNDALRQGRRESTVASLVTHSVRWTLKAMGYKGVWAMRVVTFSLSLRKVKRAKDTCFWHFCLVPSIVLMTALERHFGNFLKSKFDPGPANVWGTREEILVKCYGLWVMGYGINFPANEVGGSKNLWGMGEYGLRGIWVMREATVLA
ncbi:hypothetical protein ARMGADRAFT_1029721 [Armillaria gallica]|uniref:Uncharacterized protein n=1 Tax=Armillaria gallica TaxID=47427 RepID=A0A2H3DJ15_ARMGA|nr:hypothetical protein ARMGADRAFT_1029721 [Armillaria gallica]